MIHFFLRMFGAGLLSAEGHALIDQDRNPLVVESMVGSITFRNFRAPGRYSVYRRNWFLGSLAVSKSRVVPYRYGSTVVNIPFEDTRIRQVYFSSKRQDRLSMCSMHPCSSHPVPARSKFASRILTQPTLCH